MNRLFMLVLAFASFACSSEESSKEEGIYAPCDGTAGSCRLVTMMGGTGQPTRCLCTNYCKVDTDCPTPASGSSVPVCAPFGDYEEDGHTASCTLPCDANVACPNGMECVEGECWALSD